MFGQLNKLTIGLFLISFSGAQAHAGPTDPKGPRFKDSVKVMVIVPDSRKGGSQEQRFLEAVSKAIGRQYETRARAAGYIDRLTDIRNTISYTSQRIGRNTILHVHRFHYSHPAPENLLTSLVPLHSGEGSAIQDTYLVNSVLSGHSLGLSPLAGQNSRNAFQAVAEYDQVYRPEEASTQTAYSSLSTNSAKSGY